ncbi:MAG: condensation domain-containing protein, partial [Gemmatimonadales bacterium]
MTATAEEREERRRELERRLAGLSPTKRALLERGALGAMTRSTVGGAATITRRPPDSPAPMSFAQELVWVLERTNPGSTYNLSRLARIRGGLDCDALQRSVDALVARHEILRTTFAVVDGEPRQLIQEPRPVPIDRIDLRAMPESERDPEIIRRARVLMARPFNLAVDLQLRTTLFQLHADDHVLLLESHHIATDGWSRSILLRELTLLYDGFHSGKPVELPALAIQYADFAVWQRSYLRGEALERELAYWRRQLAGAPARLELPTDRPRPMGPSFAGAKRTAWLPPALLERLRHLSQEHGVTLYMTLLAAFDVLLARYSGETEILVGSPIAGRLHPETHGVMGFFTNTLVMRTSLEGDPSVPELLRRVRDVCLGAHDHQEVPFEKLVFELQREHGGRTPLLQATFTLHDPEPDTLQISGVTVVPVGVPSPATKFDLSLFTEESSRGLRTSMEYRTDLFDGETVERMLGHYRTLLESLVRASDQPVSRLAMLPPGEYSMVMGSGTDGALRYPTDKLVSDLVAEQATRTPDAIAIETDDGGVRLTYAELERQSNQLAWELRRM